MKIITTAIIKGGAGKSTTAAALAQAAIANKKKVLCIDLDPQGNLSAFIGADPNQPGAYQLLEGAAPEDVTQATMQGMDAIAASPDLATIRTATGSAKRLQRALTQLKKKYSLVIIDTPPQMGELTYNALQAATGLLIPLETDSGSLQGLYHITDIARQMQRSNPGLSIIGTVLTRYETTANYNKYLREVITEKGQEIGAPLLGAIRKGIAVKEAQGFQQSLFDYAPRSRPAVDYRALYMKIARK